VIIGGQMFSLLLSLLVTPVMYSLIDSIETRLGRLWGRGQTPLAPSGEPVHRVGSTDLIAGIPTQAPAASG
jgi:hypothetical protein